MANMECPICKKRVLFVGVHDDEGNYHGLMGCEYENAPWSGLSYALHHDGWGDCPLCTDGAYSAMGGMLFDTAEDAISSLLQPNEWVSVEERRPKYNIREDGELVSSKILCYCETDKTVHLAVSRKFYTARKGEIVHPVFRYYDEWGDEIEDVSHWMPLPAAPDKGNNVPIKAPNEPLTLEQLREMDGQPVYCGDRKEWGIIHIDPDGPWANVPFFRGVYCDLDVQHNGPTLYAYPPAHIDREAWKSCKLCEKYKVFQFNAWEKPEMSLGNIDCMGTSLFCPHCGRPLTEQAWDELEKRLRGM